MKNFEKNAELYGKYTVAFATSNCADCHINLHYINEIFSYYEGGQDKSSVKGGVCVACLEVDLDRKLKEADFVDAPINYSGLASPRLFNRLGNKFTEYRKVDYSWMKGVPADHGEEYVLHERLKWSHVFEKVKEIRYFSNKSIADYKVEYILIFNESDLWQEFEFVEDYKSSLISMILKRGDSIFKLSFSDGFHTDLEIETSFISMKYEYLGLNDPRLLQLLEDFDQKTGMFLQV